MLETYLSSSPCPLPFPLWCYFHTTLPWGALWGHRAVPPAAFLVGGASLLFILLLAYLFLHHPGLSRILFLFVSIQPSIPWYESPLALTPQLPPLPTPNPSFCQCPPSQQLLLKPVLSSIWMILDSHTTSIKRNLLCFPTLALQIHLCVPRVRGGWHQQSLQSTGLTSFFHTLNVQSVS